MGSCARAKGYQTAGFSKHIRCILMSWLHLINSAPMSAKIMGLGNFVWRQKDSTDRLCEDSESLMNYQRRP